MGPKIPGSASTKAMSAMSYDSTDSGVYELEDEYSFVITEFSSPELIAKVEYEFQSPSEELGNFHSSHFISPPASNEVSRVLGTQLVSLLEYSPDLTIMGTACKRLLSGQQKTKLEEKEVLESLRSEGLLTVNASKKAGCVRFVNNG